MKAEESVKNYPSTLRMYTNYTTREIKKVCKTIGPRGSGSKEERAAQDALFDEAIKKQNLRELHDTLLSFFWGE